jgi:CRISPR/Cas system-associated protein Csx1
MTRKETSMGDLANGHDCDAFIEAFAQDMISKYRSEFLDRTFEDRVSYYVMADENWEVHLYAAIKTGIIEDDEEIEEHVRVEHARPFYPTSDDIIDQIVEAFDISEQEAERRFGGWGVVEQMTTG